MNRNQLGLRRGVVAGSLAVMTAWLFGLTATAQQLTTTDIVAYVAALTICMKEEGYMDTEDAAKLAMKVLDDYGKKYNVSWDRMRRITQDENLRPKALGIVKTVGGCRALIDRWDKQ